MKWEYLHLVVYYQESAGAGRVTHVNGLQLEKTPYFHAKGETMIETLNRLGAQGWELIAAATHDTYLMKRRID